jgi:hypothetical protein
LSASRIIYVEYVTIEIVILNFPFLASMDSSHKYFKGSHVRCAIRPR